MLLNHPPNKVLVTGQGGTGKSTFWTRYILNSKHDYHFIFDNELEFVQRCAPYLNATGSPEGLDAQLETGWVIYDPTEMFDEDFEAAFNFFCDWVYTISADLPGTKLFCCDEIQELVDTNNISTEFRRLIRLGRRRGIDAILIAQEPNSIHNKLRNQLTEVVAFQQLTDNALEFLVALGFDAEELRLLNTGDFVDKRTRPPLTIERANVFTLGKSLTPPPDPG